MAHDLFVSYSQPDRDAAFALVQRMETRGIGVWIAPRDISPAADWAAKIIDAISTAKIMILVFSSNSNDSAQVRREVERAVHKRLPILPFRIEDVLPSKSLEYFLSAQHWMDAYPPPLEPHIDRLCDYLDTALGGNAARAHVTQHSPTHDGAAADAGHSLSIDTSHLRQLESALAKHIGPLSGYLVRRATLAGGDLDVLARRLALEIDDEHERRMFLESCWRIGKDT